MQLSRKRPTPAVAAAVLIGALFLSASVGPVADATKKPKSLAKPRPTTRRTTKVKSRTTVPASTPVPEATTVPPPVGVSAQATERVIAAVGDLVCDEKGNKSGTECQQVEVSDELVADKSIQSLLLLGDLQYDTGTLRGFQSEYEKTYGRLNSMAIPTPGNHEYGTKDAAGYFMYFGAKAHAETNGYYSLDISASWHVVVLNSNCDAIGGCGNESAQMKWLIADLAANKRPCTVAIWHHPLFTSAERGPNNFMGAMWDALDSGGTDLVLVGHEHQYERFAAQHRDGTAAENGMRQFVVGTGGKSVYPFAAPVTNSEFRQTGFGFLRLELKPSGYSWKFVNAPAAKPINDTGSATCH
jgi:acid phosphatase type 7